MGLRGPQPKPTALRIVEGNLSKRPLPVNEPQYPPGIPDRPANLSAGARKVWNELVFEMADKRVLRRVDKFALAQLCEDQAMLDEARLGIRKMMVQIKASAKKEGKKLAGGPTVELLRSMDGRRMMSSVRELSTQVILQRREFGLTPASNARVQSIGGKVEDDIIDAALFG